jgi:hypothetical protein
MDFEAMFITVYAPQQRMCFVHAKEDLTAADFLTIIKTERKMKFGGAPRGQIWLYP